MSTEDNAASSRRSPATLRPRSCASWLMWSPSAACSSRPRTPSITVTGCRGWQPNSARASQTADNYMNAARFAANFETVSHLKLRPTALYFLGSTR